MVDDVTQECLAVVPGTSISGRRVAPELPTLIERRSRPGIIAWDNRTELSSNAVMKWSAESKVEWNYVALGKPMQTNFLESDNGRVRGEFWHETMLRNLARARDLIATWMNGYNIERPHWALGYPTRAGFVLHLTTAIGERHKSATGSGHCRRDVKWQL